MKIAVGSDHAGYRRKKEIVKFLSKLGHKVVDVGCHSEDSVDYPDYARAVAEAVAAGRAQRCMRSRGKCLKIRRTLPS